MMCNRNRNKVKCSRVFDCRSGTSTASSLYDDHAADATASRRPCCSDSKPLQERGASKLRQQPQAQVKSVLGFFIIVGLQNSVGAQSFTNSTNAPSESTDNVTAAPITKAPTMAPSQSHEPTLFPTRSFRPTLSLRPSVRPTNSRHPTVSPTEPPPTYAPVPIPTGSPTEEQIFPSAQPSYNETISVMRQCSQNLDISSGAEFDTIMVGIYETLLQSYTVNFGEMIGSPYIETNCTVTEQKLSGRKKKRWENIFSSIKNLFSYGNSTGVRNLQSTESGTILQVSFSMIYSTRYGYDINTYPSQFGTWMNNNLELVTKDMQQRFLPVIEAKEVVVFQTEAPTISPVPTLAPRVPTNSPIRANETQRPSVTVSEMPSISTAPTGSRSPVVPIVDTPKPTRQEIVNDQTSFVVGLAAGLSGAALVVLLFILYTKRQMRQRKNEERGIRSSESDLSRRSKGVIELVSSNNNNNGKAQSPINGLEEGTRTQITGEITEQMDAIVSNPSMVSEGGSLGSNPYDIQEGVPVETLQDEFDNYKNQDLEFMRNGVEESVYGAEGMMSLAMTRALMEEEEDSVDWGGAQDCASMEANIFCDVNDWLRKSDNATLEQRIACFQGILNKMVITVRRNMVRPADGTRAIHCCAAMLGIPLETDLPNNVLLIWGMRKTSDINQGRIHLIEAFKPFGDIESAGINPKNKGFGFVRFIHPKSVERALDRFRVSEIEVQDVSVMMKTLKPDNMPTL